MKKVLVKVILFTLYVSLFSIKIAHAAYIDPNLGGMLFQILIVLFGIFSGVLLLFSSRLKSVFYRFMRYLRRSKSESQPQAETKNEDEQANVEKDTQS